MKKALLSIVALLACFLSFPVDSWAIKNSTALIAEDNLSSNIDKETGGIPIGSVTAWPFPTLPAGGDWLECDGRTISAAAYPEYVKQFGNRLPDYRGVFLRSRGGNAGALGTLQAESVNVPASAGIKMHVDGIAKGEYTTTGSGSTQTDCDGGEHDGSNAICTTTSNSTIYKAIPFTSKEVVNNQVWERGYGWRPQGPDTTRKNAMNAIGVSADGMDIPIQIVSPYNETRPNNKAVIYIVRVR